MDSLHLAKEKMITENHLSAKGNQDPSDEMTARPDDTEKIEDPSSVHDSLAGIEEDDNFVEAVNG